MPHPSEILEFINGFTAHSEKYRDQFVPGWMEVLENYLVRGPGDGSTTTADPLGRWSNSSTLRDPETHQVIETLLAKLMLVLFPPEGNFVAAHRRGREDATAARTVTDLLKYAFGLRGHYRVFHNGLKSMLLTGTSIVQSGWKLIERPRTMRDIIVEGGIETVREFRVPNYPVYDDVALSNVDIMDFLPDPGSDNLEDMLCAGKHFSITKNEALRRAARGQYNREAVERAIARGACEKVNQAMKRDAWRPERGQGNTPFAAFDSMQGVEIWGEWPGALHADGERWRVLTMLNGEIVRDIPWPLDDHRLPFYDLTICPIEGRFYGMSPGEGIRHQQDFLNFLLCMMADSVLRSVHPPIVYNRDDEIDLAKLAAWSPDVPIASERPNDIHALSYGADKFSAFTMFQNIKQSIQAQSGALGSIQGQGLGINRASATEAERTFRMALDRPELMGRYIETECLRPIGQSIIKQYQQNLVDSQELADRIGTSPSPVSLAQINADFDVEFVGSRNFRTAASRMQSIDRILQLLSIPQAAQTIPMDELVIQILEGFGYDELLQLVGQPEVVGQNLLMQQVLGGKGLYGNNNGESMEPPGGALEQQLAGLLPE